MSATDDLRRLLDERGVKWEMPTDIMSHIKTVWRSGLWEYTAIETSGGEFSVYAEHRDWITPEQVIDATLGNGEIDELEDDYCTLIRENKHICDQLARVKGHLVEAAERNDKLRELVCYIMHQCNDDNPRCDECIGWNDGECVALQRMRELGVIE